MKITSISLTNFRSFKKTQTIELAPVTLLFGPNSVGKSSVLMAIAYVQHILEKGECDPKKLDAMGGALIGGFQSLVHGNNLNETIKISIAFDSGNTPFSFYDNGLSELISLIPNANYLVMDDFADATECGELEFEISWSKQLNTAYVKCYRVWINKQYVGQIQSDPGGKQTRIIELNGRHQLLISSEHMEWLSNNSDELDSEYFESMETELESTLQRLNPNREEPPNKLSTKAAREEFKNYVSPIGVKCKFGAIPFLSRPLVMNLNGDEIHDGLEDHLDFRVVQKTLTHAFVLPLDYLLNYLSHSAMIGPLRVVPNLDYVPNPHPEQKDWVDGSAAWDLLHKDPNKNEYIKKLLKDTSDCFGSTEKLNSGYEVINKSIAEACQVDSSSEFTGLLNKRHLFFKELRSDFLLSANQLGTGISQILPIVVAAHNGDLSLISVEQPELHIHPRLQVDLADIFIRSKDKHSFLIETHSEHLILRILKRIRQTTNEELPENIIGIVDSDISIIYLEPTKEGILTKKIRVDEDGEFIDRWPKGFFAERREELL